MRRRIPRISLQVATQAQTATDRVAPKVRAPTLAQRARAPRTRKASPIVLSYLVRKRNFITKTANAAVVGALIVGFSLWAADANAADAMVQKQIQEAERAANRGPYATDGVFTGTAQGYGGPVTMQVTVKGGYIDDVRVVDAPNEDGPYLEQAVKLIDDMLVKQTPNVDTVSGATFSSAGIINGAVQALETSNSGQADAAASLEGGE